LPWNYNDLSNFYNPVPFFNHNFALPITGRKNSLVGPKSIVMNRKTPFVPFFALFLLLCHGGLLSCSQDDKKSNNGEFPIPYPEGGELITDAWDGTLGHRTVQYEADRHEALIAFYDDYSGGIPWTRSEAGSGSELSVIYVNLEKGHTIDLGPPEDQIPGAVLLTLYVSGD